MVRPCQSSSLQLSVFTSPFNFSIALFYPMFPLHGTAWIAWTWLTQNCSFSVFYCWNLWKVSGTWGIFWVTLVKIQPDTKCLTENTQHHSPYFWSCHSIKNTPWSNEGCRHSSLDASEIISKLKDILYFSCVFVHLMFLWWMAISPTCNEGGISCRETKLRKVTGIKNMSQNELSHSKQWKQDIRALQLVTLTSTYPALSCSILV